MSEVFEPTRAAGLARMHAFVPRAGRAYADGRFARCRALMQSADFTLHLAAVASGPQHGQEGVAQGGGGGGDHAAI